MKKILLVNTKYREFGGEDSNFSQEIAFLSSKYVVDFVEYDNSEKIKPADIFSFIFNINPSSNKILVSKIKEFNPDIIYVHNTWYKAGLGIFSTIRKQNIPILLKIHNFRFDCTNSYFSKKHLKNEEFCHKCGFDGKNNIINKYFSESVIKSLIVIRYGKKYIKILKNFKLKIIVMTEFQKNYLLNLGIEPKKIHVLENPIFIDKEEKSTYNPKSNYVIYAGRISKEKGVEDLIRTWKNSENNHLTLKIVGTGEQFSYLKNKYQIKNIEFLGQLPNNDVLELIKNSRSVVTATKMYEGQPRLLCEASIYGVPAIYPSFGGMVEFYDNDYEFKFEQYDYIDLQKKFNLLSDKEKLIQTSKNVSSFIQTKLSNTALHDKFKRIDLIEYD